MRNTQRTPLEQKLIDEAKLMLIYVDGMSEPEAHSKLQKLCMYHRLKLPEVALIILKEKTAELDASYST